MGNKCFKESDKDDVALQIKLAKSDITSVSAFTDNQMTRSTASVVTAQGVKIFKTLLEATMNGLNLKGHMWPFYRRQWLAMISKLSLFITPQSSSSDNQSYA